MWHDWIDNLRIYVLFNSISVISGRLEGDNKRLCAMEPCLLLIRFHLRESNSERSRSSGQRFAHRVTWAHDMEETMYIRDRNIAVLMGFFLIYLFISETNTKL